MCVEKWGESLGGHVVVRNSEDNEERSCVPCLVSVLHSSLLPLFRHVFDSGFRRRGREKQGLVRVENVSNVVVGVLLPFSCRQYGESVLVSVACGMRVVNRVSNSIVQASMEGNEEPQTPEPSRGFKVGDLVHVYNGTSAGTS